MNCSPTETPVPISKTRLLVQPDRTDLPSQYKISWVSRLPLVYLHESELPSQPQPFCVSICLALLPSLNAPLRAVLSLEALGSTLVLSNLNPLFYR